MGKHRIGERTCMGCGRKTYKKDLLRFVVHDNEEVLFDSKQNMPGRGGYLCPKQTCFSLAGKKRKKAVRLRRANKIDPSSLLQIAGVRRACEADDLNVREGEKGFSQAGKA